MARDPLLAAMGRLLREHEFRTKGARWFRDGGEVIDLVEVQGARSGDGFFLNLGVLLRETAPQLLEPASYECTVTRRLDDAGREAPALVAEAIAWFASVGSRRKIEALLANGPDDVHLIRDAALAKLPPLPPPSPPPAPTRVRHPTFGTGVITRADGASVEVTFADGGVRRIRRDFLETLG